MNSDLIQHLAQVTEEEKKLLTGKNVDLKAYGALHTGRVDSAKLLERGELISIRPHTRFAPFPRHYHNYVEMMYMCAGSTTHIINGEQEVTLSAGELLLFNQHASHAIERAGEGDIAVNFIVLPQFFDVALDMIGSDNVLGEFLLGSLQRSGGPVSFLHFRVADFLPVQNLLENMVWTIVHQVPNARKINQVTMGLLFLELLSNTASLSLPDPTWKENAAVVRVLKEIEENYKLVSLSELAEERGVTAACLSGTVHRVTGKTFKQLLQAKRLSKAAELLRQTRLSVEEVSEAVGYENTSYFYRIFQKQFGLTPKQYRNEIK